MLLGYLMGKESVIFVLMIEINLIVIMILAMKKEQDEETGKGEENENHDTQSVATTPTNRGQIWLQEAGVDNSLGEQSGRRANIFENLVILTDRDQNFFN